MADDVHHMAVALHRKGLGDLDAAHLGNAANVVARQINQHHMLGALLGVLDQLLLNGFVPLWRGATRAGAGQRPDGDLPPHFGFGRIAAGIDLLQAHQDFGRRPHHMKVTHVVVIHVGAGVQRAQGSVQRQGAFGVALFQPLTDLHLHEVARLDQAFGALHRL